MFCSMKSPDVCRQSARLFFHVNISGARVWTAVRVVLVCGRGRGGLKSVCQPSYLPIRACGVASKPHELCSRPIFGFNIANIKLSVIAIKNNSI